MCHAAVLGACLAMLCLSACEANLDTSLESKECNGQGECLPGYVCSTEHLCVPSDAGSRSDPNGMPPDAGERDARTAVTTSCEPGSLCDGACVNISSDVANCGSCGRRCPGSEHGSAACSAGACRLECAEGHEACGDGCYPLQSDPLHCGTCSNSCGDVEGGVAVCEAGKCSARCLSGFTKCGGVCVRSEVDPAHCGKCGNACQPDQRCSGGACVGNCPAGTLACARGCVDVQSEPMHCGACEQACSAPAGALASCQSAKCSWTCAGTLSKCGEACLDLQSDVANCGECGKHCAAPPANGMRACERGMCVLRCAAGFTDCDGQCVDGGVVESARAAGLGTLGVCAAQLAVQNRMKCAGMGQNATYCSGACVNIDTNTKHCGGCGHACSAQQFCYRGMCF